jgi:polysaccharide export outer membrane protein
MRAMHFFLDVYNRARKEKRPPLTYPSGGLRAASSAIVFSRQATVMLADRAVSWAALSMAFVGLACLASLTGCTSTPGDTVGVSGAPAASQAEIARAAGKYVATSTPGAAGYLVGPQDVLDVTVFKAPDLSKTLQVAEDGTINLPLTGQMMAAGRSPSQLEREIQTRLNARYLKSPQVTVFVKEYNSQRVTVEGAVKTPGVFPLRGHETLMQVIAKGGGLDRETASSSVVIFRTTDGARTVARYDIGSVRSGGEPDPQVLPGDVIVVDDSMAKQGLQVFLKLTPLATPIHYLF